MENSDSNTLLITGIPRSGTSLITKLISQQDNTLCFSEPNWLREIRHDNQTSEEFKEQLLIKVALIRDEIKNGNPIEIMVKKGSKQLPDNYYSRQPGKIENLKETIKVHIDYSDDLVICIKSNALFTACLKPLVEEKSWHVITAVRNPLYVLMSWRSLNIPISYGKITIGEIYSAEIRGIVKDQDLLTKQVKILNWFFKQYQKFDSNIIKYEDLIDNPQKILSKMLHTKPKIVHQLHSQNNTQRYNSSESNLLKTKIDDYCEYGLKYYDVL